jgi:SAM-dependent methyltransferase
MQEHFSRLAPDYNALHTTDAAPVRIIAQTRAASRVTRFADMGCGSGRYDLLLLRVSWRAPDVLGHQCGDAQEAGKYLRAHGQRRFSLRRVDAESLPAGGGRYDFIVSFNAIHHFDPLPFLRRARGLLRPAGRIFLYTRLREQNAGTIWGRYFPSFLDENSGFTGRRRSTRGRAACGGWNCARSGACSIGAPRRCAGWSSWLGAGTIRLSSTTRTASSRRPLTCSASASVSVTRAPRVFSGAKATL